MSYKEPKEVSKKVPEPDWTYVLEQKENKMYDQTKPPAAKESKAGAGYMQGGEGVTKSTFGM